MAPCGYCVAWRDGRCNVKTSASYEEVVNEVLERYLQQLEAGEVPNREELLAQYTDVKEELAGCLDGLKFVHRVAPQLFSAEKHTETDSPPDAPFHGELGDFRIGQEIGRGGMGVVYEAEQISLKRRVALKVLPFASVLDPRRLKRFENEVDRIEQRSVEVEQIGFHPSVAILSAVRTGVENAARELGFHSANAAA